MDRTPTGARLVPLDDCKRTEETLMEGVESGTGSASSSPARSSKKPSPADFMFGVTLGEGAYARVSGVAARWKRA